VVDRTRTVHHTSITLTSNPSVKPPDGFVKAPQGALSFLGIVSLYQPICEPRLSATACERDGL